MMLETNNEAKVEKNNQWIASFDRPCTSEYVLPFFVGGVVLIKNMIRDHLNQNAPGWHEKVSYEIGKS